MRPISAVTPKALLPLVDAAGRLRSVIHGIVREAAAAGIETAALITSSGQAPAVQAYFRAAAESGDADGLPEIITIDQPSPAGFGDAVLQARSFVGPEPFVVMLGDHLYLAADGAKCCVAQVTDAFEAYRGVAMIGMQVVPADAVSRVGVARGEAVVADHVYRCRELVEKPSAEVVRATLQTPGLGADAFLAHAGIYAFTADIFAALAELTEATNGEEVGLTAAQQIVLIRRPADYYLVRLAGDVLDVGYPAGYAEAFKAIRQVTWS
jgi:UTP--glucose-1-phosphate uridylyltransferase